MPGVRITILRISLISPEAKRRSWFCLDNTVVKSWYTVMGRKHNRTAPTTSTVVFSALFSFTNLSISVCGSCWVLILFRWRRVSRYKIMWVTTIKIILKDSAKKCKVFIEYFEMSDFTKLNTPIINEKDQTARTDTLMFRFLTMYE